MDPTAIHDKVVLIGITAISVKDVFYTPYSHGRRLTNGLLAWPYKRIVSANCSGLPWKGTP